MHITFMIFKEERLGTIPFNIVNDTPFTIIFAQESDDCIQLKNTTHTQLLIQSLLNNLDLTTSQAIPGLWAITTNLIGEGENKKFKVTKKYYPKPSGSVDSFRDFIGLVSNIGVGVIYFLSNQLKVHASFQKEFRKKNMIRAKEPYEEHCLRCLQYTEQGYWYNR